MSKKRFQFMVKSKTPPKVELSDAGLYLRFQKGGEVAKTVLQSEWPHVAVDLDSNNSVIGIEVVPAPAAFSIGMLTRIVQEAKIGGVPKYNPKDVEIENLSYA